MQFRHVLFAFAGIAISLPLYGQAVPSREPSSTHIFPAGGQRGTSVKVRVGGECLPPGMSFKLYGDGVTAADMLGTEVKARYEPSIRRPPRDADGIGAANANPREWPSEIKIASNAELGARHWRVAGAWGGTQPRPFIVGDLPEFIETESNSLPERAESVVLPIVINGQIAGERDQDFFEFAAKAGEVVVCDVLSARIGSPLDPILTITDARGTRMETQEVRVGSDPVLAFKAATAGKYRLHVANLGFAGGPAYVYRITLSTTPYAPFAFPLAARAGETRELDFYTLTGSGALKATKEKVTFPAKPGLFLHRGVTPLFATEVNEMAEAAGNRTAATAMELTVPVGVSGRFLTPNEEDWYRFTAKKGEAFTISCRPFPFDSPAMPMLTLQDATGAGLATSSSVDAADRAIDLDWIAPADGQFRIRLRDLQHGTRGGPEFSYRLTVSPAKPDFALRLEPDFVNVVQGGKTEIDLIVRRSGGFAGPIDLKVTGLPESVKLEPATIPAGVPRLKLSISAKDDCRPTDSVVSIVGRATINKEALERPAMVSTFGREGTNLFVTIQHKPLFKITCNEAYQYAYRGTVYPYALAIERLNGFDGPITLQVCDRQVQDLDGIDVVESIVLPGVKASPALVYLPETMHASVQHHSRPYVQGHATFTDKWGQKQTILAVCDKRCMIRTLPPVVKLRAESKELEASAGSEVSCKLFVDRTSNFTGPAEVELVEHPGFSADRVQVKTGKNALSIRVQVASGLSYRDDQPLRFRLTGKLPSGATVISEATVVLHLK